MSDKVDLTKLGFVDFQRLAVDPSLSRCEKVGFPDAYRAGWESAILDDIVGKLTNLTLSQRRVVDIGPGCSDLSLMLIDLCRAQGHSMTLIDGLEMLSQLPDGIGVQKIADSFPNCTDFIEANRGKVDAIVCYSVLHYIFAEASFFRFLDSSLALLAPSGQMLIGDIPNFSKRKRFFSSEAGISFHRQFMKTTDTPIVCFNQLDPEQIDDAVIFMILQRSRASGFDAYVLPQRRDLPMANRREDLLIVRP